MEPDLDANKTGRGFLRRLFCRTGPSEVARDREATVLAFASGKGGTGKSFLTTNVAIALHRAGRRVAVVDCDFGLANAHLLFGVNPRLSMQHLLDGVASVQEVLTPTPFGPSLVAGGSGVSSLAEIDARHMQVVARGVHWLASTHDAVLLDCPAGLAPQAMIMVLAAQHVVIVTNPEIAALTDAYALIKCLARQPRVPEIQVVVNRVVELGLGQPTFERLAEVAQRFIGRSLHYIGEIPDNPAVSHRRLGQAPLLVSHPECNAAMGVRTVMLAIEHTMGPLRASGSKKEDGVERRILRLLREH